jgi:MFS family permease
VPLCAAEVLSMTTFSTFPALIPVLLGEWNLTNSEAGLISGMFFGGYMAAVPVLGSLTDRVDARRVYVVACLLAAAGSLGFALLANGVLTGVLFQALVGIGLAGTYMPGLKLLSDRIDGPHRSRHVAFYTSTFGVGTSVSLLVVAAVEPTLGWRAVFVASAVGPLAAAGIVWTTLPPSKVLAHPETPKHLLDFSHVFRNRAATGYILGYAAHNFELFGVRSWIVAFLAFCAAQAPAAALPWSAAAVIAVIGPIGIPASLLGNEIASRYRRRNVILTIMALSATMAAVFGFVAPVLPWPLLVVMLALYFFLMMFDSSALTNGVIAEASPHLRGATMAVYSFVGFGAGLLSPLVFGAVLDLAGGNTSRFAWGLAFAGLGLGCATGPMALLLSRVRRRRTAGATAV